MLDDTNPDWIPSVLMGYATKEGDFDCYHRCKKRMAHSDDDDNSVKSVRVDSSAVNNVPLDSSIPVGSSTSVPVESSITESLDVPEQASTLQLEEIATAESTLMDCEESDLYVEYLGLEDELAHLRLDNQKLRDENIKLRSQVIVFTPHLFENDKNILQFYTALPN